jgi:hypothetical protein
MRHTKLCLWMFYIFSGCLPILECIQFPKVHVCRSCFSSALLCLDRCVCLCLILLETFQLVSCIWRRISFSFRAIYSHHPHTWSGACPIWPTLIDSD